jgi:RND family efflux transporter MFP subunit
VRYIEVSRAGSIEQRTYPGTTQAELALDLSFRVAGSITDRYVNVGDEVSRGQIIAKLDTDDFEARRREALARRDAAEAAVVNADADLARVRQLYENRNLSRREYDAAVAAAESARAQRDAAAQQYEAAQLQLERTAIFAPRECAVAQVFAETNQNVAAGQPIARLNCGQCSEVLVSVPEVDIGRINERSAVSVSVNALGISGIQAIVREIGVDTGPSSATFPVTVGLQDPEQCQAIRAGMAAEVEFELERVGPEGALIVPLVAVGEDRKSEEKYVFVLERAAGDEWVARKRTVTVGAPTPNGLIIEAGLEEGELIATAGVRRILNDGQRVNLLGEDDAARL